VNNAPRFLCPELTLGLMQPDAIAVLVRDLRIERELTIEALSERSGVSVRGISDIERGVTLAPRRGTLTALADGLGLHEEGRGTLLLAARRARTVESTLPATLRPLRLNDFTGRVSELQSLESFVQTPAAVVAITGPGGFGKTSLALEGVSRFAPAEGVAFVDLGGNGRPPLTPLEVVQLVLRQTDEDLAEPPIGLDEAIARWKSVAALRHPTVLLDNATSEDQVRPLLAAEERGPLIFTSRRTLAGITATGRIVLDSLLTLNSVELLERIIPVQQQDGNSIADLAALCHGVPLALRIAANRVASRPATTVGDYVGRMQSEARRLSFLVAGDMSVEAVFALSYDELDDVSAKVFRVLSIIDGVTFDAAIAGAAVGLSEPITEEQLEHLVDLGLLESRGGNRYRLHDLLRVFASTRLRMVSSEDEISIEQDRLMGWLITTMVDVVTDPEAPRAGSGVSGNVGRFDRVRARAWVLANSEHWWPAVQRAFSVADHERVVEVAGAVGWKLALWPEWGHWYELSELALRSSQALGSLPAIAFQGGVLAQLAMTERGDPLLAQKIAREALVIAERAADQYGISRSKFLIGWAGAYGGQIDGVMDNLEAAIDGYATVGAYPDMRQAQAVLGMLHRRLGHTERAIADLSAVQAALPQEINPETEAYADSFARAVTLEELANSYVEYGDAEAALATADELMRTTLLYDLDYITARAHVVHARALLAAERRDEVLAELAIVESLIAPFPNIGHGAMIRVEVSALLEAARGGGIVPGGIADLNAAREARDV